MARPTQAAAGCFSNSMARSPGGTPPGIGGDARPAVRGNMRHNASTVPVSTEAVACILASGQHGVQDLTVAHRRTQGAQPQCGEILPVDGGALSQSGPWAGVNSRYRSR